jgi:hypothetical protein
MKSKMKNKTLIFAAAFAVVLTLAGLTSAQNKCTEAGSIRSVSKASSGNFETVTFDVMIKKPDFKVTRARPPFSEYGSEKRLRIRGRYFQSIVFRGINWECKIAEALSASTSNIKAVKSIEQFEGQVEYIIGYDKRGSYVGQSVTRTRKGSRVTLKFRK